VKATDDQHTVIDRYYEHSRVHSLARGVETASNRLGAAYDSSVLGRASERFAAITRQSWIFRWLTAEPDPEVIVVDLRETWTVGPIIVLLDWLAPHAARAWNGSLARTTAERTAAAFRAAPVKSSSALLLGVLFVQFALSWNSAGDATLAVLCLLTAFALVGLRVDWTLEELRASKVGRLAAALFVPPEPPEDET